MKRVIIVCEGATEQEFCENILQPYFMKLGVSIEAPGIKKSGGGIVGWNAIKKQLIGHLNENAIVTTFIDFYGLKESHGFPKWKDAEKIVNKSERMDFLEASMREDFDPKYHHLLHPYLQLHEFEGLLFNNIEVFDDIFDEADFVDRDAIEKVINDHPNPELINDDPETAPSKRLERFMEKYKKTIHGIILAEDIGLERMRAKCPRFNAWIAKLEE
ncbi:MAG: DUF4276 family protein [Saprospiraceae bacterium]